MNPKTMFKLSYGLFVLTSGFEGRDSGCIINTAGQVTSEPNRISITVNKANFTHDLVMSSKKFNISVLSEEASFDIFRHLASSPAVTQTNFQISKTVCAAPTGFTT